VLDLCCYGHLLSWIEADYMCATLPTDPNTEPEQVDHPKEDLLCTFPSI